MKNQGKQNKKLVVCIFVKVLMSVCVPRQGLKSSLVISENSQASREDRPTDHFLRAAEAAAGWHSASEWKRMTQYSALGKAKPKETLALSLISAGPSLWTILASTA